MKRKVILIIGILSLFINSCFKSHFEEGRHSYFKFENNSNIDITVNTNNTGWNDNTNIIYVSKLGINDYDMVVYANSTNNILRLRPPTSWEGIINNRLKDDKKKKYDTLKLFIFDYAKIMNYNSSVRPYNVPFDSVFLQRYDLTIKDLDNIGWKLSYPPDERMKDIKMYPPYGLQLPP